MIFDNFLEILMSSVILWLFAEEVLFRPKRKPRPQPVVQEIVPNDIRPV